MVTGGFTSSNHIPWAGPLSDQCPDPGVEDPALMSRLVGLYNGYAGNRPKIPNCGDIGCASLDPGVNIDNHANFGEHGWADPAYHWDDEQIRVSSTGGKTIFVSQTKDLAAANAARIRHAQEILKSATAQSCLTTGGVIGRDARKKLDCYGEKKRATRVAAVDASGARVVSDCWSRGGAVSGSGGKITCVAAPTDRGLTVRKAGGAAQ